MADPLSIAASVAGLALLARDLAKGIKEFTDSVKGSDKEIHGLYSGVVSLYAELQGVSLVIEQMEDLGLRNTTQGGIIEDCNTTIDAIWKLLKKYGVDRQDAENHAVTEYRKRGRWETMKQRKRWYFDKDQVQKLCTDLEHHKSTLSLAMSKDSGSALVEVLRLQATASHNLDEIRTIQAGIVDRQLAQNERELTREQGRMMKDFSDIEPKESLKKHIKLRQEGTGKWFFGSPDFLDFMSENNSRLWLYGIPGAGKSVLSATIIEHVEKLRTSGVQNLRDPAVNGLQTPSVMTAFFFCQHDDPNTQDARSILGSIARQLSIQHADALADMEAFYQEHTAFDKFTADDNSLVALIWDMSKHVDITIIVVDGLDECLKDRAQVVKTLAELSDSDNGTVKTLFTSRDEHDIRDGLTTFDSMELETPKADVRLFVAAELESRFKTLTSKNIDLKDEILRHLVENSDGM